jgi:hypothetical protein
VSEGTQLYTKGTGQVRAWRVAGTGIVSSFDKVALMRDTCRTTLALHSSYTGKRIRLWKQPQQKLCKEAKIAFI